MFPSASNKRGHELVFGIQSILCRRATLSKQWMTPDPSRFSRLSELARSSSTCQALLASLFRVTVCRVGDNHRRLLHSRQKRPADETYISAQSPVVGERRVGTERPVNGHRTVVQCWFSRIRRTHSSTTSLYTRHRGRAQEHGSFSSHCHGLPPHQQVRYSLESQIRNSA